MVRQIDNAIKPTIEMERRQLLFRKLADSDSIDGVVSSMNAPRRSMRIAEIQ
jgi:hypothetical protein